MPKANWFEQAITTPGINRECLYRKTWYPSLLTALAQHNPMPLYLHPVSKLRHHPPYSLPNKPTVFLQGMLLQKMQCHYLQYSEYWNSGWQRFCTSQRNQCVFHVICQPNSTTKYIFPPQKYIFKGQLVLLLCLELLSAISYSKPKLFFV